MTTQALPESVLERFRTLSLDRIGRVEATWNALYQGGEDEAAVKQMLRDVHTLKGDARVVGYEAVGTICHKLEELLVLAGEHRYQVSDDFELVVTMAIQFLGMLLRMKPGAELSGVDLDGFARQVDEILRETRALPARRRRTSGVRAAVEVAIDRLAEATREKLAVAATMAYIEYLTARGAVSRGRLRNIWETLRDELARIHAAPLAPVFEAHVVAAADLADELGKEVEVDVDVDGVRADARVVEAIEVAALHLVRNAIDHGIELPAVRETAGKPRRGTIAIDARERAGMIELRFVDDGAGVDLAAVRARAARRGLLDPAQAAAADTAELCGLLFHAGFSTRDDASVVSGRGVGLDAVKAAVIRAGGRVSIATAPGRGTTVTITVPAPVRQLHVYAFRAPAGAMALAVSARWTPTTERLGPDALDPLSALRMVGQGRQTSVDPSPPLADLALRLRWGFLELSVRAGSAPELVVAERVCPTPEDFPAEVILVDGRETLLLRPEYLFELGGAR